MSTKAQAKTQAKTPAAPAAARIPQPPVAGPEHEAERLDIAAQLEGAARLGHSFGALGVDLPAPPLIQRQEMPEEEEEELQLKREPAAVQRQELPEEEEEELMLKPEEGRVGPQGGQVPPEVEDAIRRARGGGQPLEGPLQEQMGASLGHDFSRVRVHTDSEADELNLQLQAKAFTSGADIFFKRGAYEPGSSSGRALLTHELTHVVQQSTGRVRGRGSRLTIRPADDAFEQEADALALQRRYGNQDLQRLMAEVRFSEEGLWEAGRPTQVIASEGGRESSPRVETDGRKQRDGVTHWARSQEGHWANIQGLAGPERGQRTRWQKPQAERDMTIIAAWGAAPEEKKGRRGHVFIMSERHNRRTPRAPKEWGRTEGAVRPAILQRARVTYKHYNWAIDDEGRPQMTGNEFADWLEGVRSEPPTEVNCWQVIFLAAVNIGLMSLEELRVMHNRLKREVTVAPTGRGWAHAFDVEYNRLLARWLSAGWKWTKWQGGAIPRNNVVRFNKGGEVAHWALAVGGTVQKRDKRGAVLTLTPIVDLWSDQGTIGGHRPITVEERRAAVAQYKAAWYIESAEEKDLVIGEQAQVYHTLPFFTQTWKL